MSDQKRTYRLEQTRIMIDLERWHRLTEGDLKFEVATAEELPQDLLEKVGCRPFTDILGCCILPIKQDDPFFIILFLKNLRNQAVAEGITWRERIVKTIVHETKHMQAFSWKPKQNLVSRFWERLQLRVPFWGELISIQKELRNIKKELEELEAMEFGAQKAKDPEWLKIVEVEMMHS